MTGPEADQVWANTDQRADQNRTRDRHRHGPLPASGQTSTGAEIDPSMADSEHTTSEALRWHVVELKRVAADNFRDLNTRRDPWVSPTVHVHGYDV